ncbi:MAG TPA: maleylpyruvate isomerase N-terminal domain-containing protein [Acidimicrobiales bacterium]|nr:maleylpyruvate isomerase N-terminal domain-containing protein [Acidimicrobiales bacterium]
MSAPSDKIEIACVGHTELLRAARKLTEGDLRRPSLLPGWDRARVLAHLAHKSHSHVSVFTGAAAGEQRSQYPSGQAAAEGETAAWSQRPADELCDLVAEGFASLERAWAAMPDQAWSRTATSSAGERAMTGFVDRHLRDLFVHHVDLDIGYVADDWPALFVSTELAKRIRDLSGRAAPHTLLAWLLGRAGAPQLGPW